MMEALGLRYLVIAGAVATLVFLATVFWYATRPTHVVLREAERIRRAPALPKTNALLAMAAAWGAEEHVYVTPTEAERARERDMERARVKRARKAKRA